MAPRPETADLARRIDEAAIRNGIDPAVIHARARRVVVLHRAIKQVEEYEKAARRATEAFHAFGLALTIALGHTPPRLD